MSSQEVYRSTSIEKEPHVESGTPDIGSDEKERNDVFLIPRPSDDPKDPLNWSYRKKLTIVAVLCIATYAGYSGPLAGQANVVQQSKLYHKTTTQMSYQGSASQAGLACGGFLFAPIAHRYGKAMVIFWTLLACMLTQVWALKMTHAGDYNGYIVSRMFSGLFGGVVGVIGPRILVDLFFLHERGRVFSAFHMALNFGIISGPTFSALFSGTTNDWPSEYWWSVALLTVSAILVFAFVEETTWDRAPGASNVKQPEGFVARKRATYLTPTKVLPPTTWGETGKIAFLPFQIGLSPVTLLLAAFTLINFGWYPASNTLTPVYLQKPVKAGGFGFTVLENAYFSFSHWIGGVAAIFYGQWVNDRLPLALSARRGGVWKPEYRLHALWLPSLILNPIGLGLFGAALQYQLHWIVLAIAAFLITIGSLALIGVTVNYICECFIRHPAEASIVVNFYRLAFGLSVNFYINDWTAAVGIGWVWGMAGFFAAGAFGFVIVLMWKGHLIRSWSLAHLESTEEGQHVVRARHGPA